jgi:hypothetical protein
LGVSGYVDPSCSSVVLYYSVQQVMRPTFCESGYHFLHLQQYEGAIILLDTQYLLVGN